MRSDTNKSHAADNESSHAIYGEVYTKMEEIRMQQPGAVSEEAVARQEVALALDAVGKNLRPGDRVLDCPCGLGVQADVLAQYKNGLQITAMDASDASIETAKARKRNVPVHFIQGMFSEMRDKVGVNSQRAVLCFKNSFGYGDTVEENIDHLQSMFDVLEEDGQMVLTWNFDPSDDINVSKLTQEIKGPPILGKDEQGRSIGAYVSVQPPKKEDQVIPEKYIPENGFDALRGDNPQAIANRTVSSFKRLEYVYIDPNGQEIRSGHTEVRQYLKPVIGNGPLGKNAPLEGDNRFYDIPLIRALCEHAGFTDVKCIPAKKLDSRNWTIGIVATKTKQVNLQAGHDVAVSDLQNEQARRLHNAVETDQVREELEVGTELDFTNMFEYSDSKTGYRVDNVVVEAVSQDVTKMRYGKMPLNIQKSTKIGMDIIDSNKQNVGHFTRRALFTDGGDILMEHHDAEMSVPGTGFGSRFHAAMEERYHQNGIKAIIRGCGLNIGRYEGAKSGFDFLDDGQRQKFISAFCAFLKEKGIHSVSIDGENFSIDNLTQRLRTPQDILAVKADEVEAVIIDREWSTEMGQWVVKKTRVEKFSPGKAFFLDQGSQAKKSLDNEFYSGKWSGIKRLV